MGNNPGRVFAGIATLGMSELARFLDKEQQAKAQQAQADVDEIARNMKMAEQEHQVKMEENRLAQREAEARVAQKNAELTAAQNSVNTTKAELEAIQKAKESEEENVEKLKKLTEGDVATFRENQELHYAKQLEAVEKLPEVAKTPKRSCAFLGKTSTGKTSCINKLFGTEEKTSPLRCTMDIKPVSETDKLEVYDVFGENDEESYHNMEILLHAKSLHTICIVYTESVDSVLKLARLVKALKVDKVYVRNKSEDLTKEEIAMVVEHDTKKLEEVTKESPSVVVLTSAKSGMGMDRLKTILEGGPVTAFVAGPQNGYGKASRSPVRGNRSSPY